MTIAPTASAVASSTGLAVAARACSSADDLVGLAETAMGKEDLVAPGKVGMSDGEVRVQSERVTQKRGRGGGVGHGDCRHEWQGAQIEVVGVKALRAFAARPFDFRSPHARLDDADHAVRDPVLKVEDVL